MSESSRPKLANPTLNEVENICTLIEDLHTALAQAPIDYELIVVDDNRKDGTAEVARQYATRKADFKVALPYFNLLGKLSRHARFGPGQR